MGFSLFPFQMLQARKIKCHFEDTGSLGSLSDHLSDYLIEQDPVRRKDPVILCVGTDRSTGDCLGPLVGWHLRRKNFSLPVYGTLDDPVHAGNLPEKIDLIQNRHPAPLIIAVDACLGKLENVGMITLGEGVIKPGSGVHKELPPVGNIYFTGIVNVAGHMEFIVLQNTRLSLVMAMAGLITDSIVLGLDKAGFAR